MDFLNIVPGGVGFKGTHRLNMDAFPDEERLDTELLAQLSEQGRLELLGIYDNGNYIGFTVIFHSERSVYVFFLAIDPAWRSHGYGAAVLDELRKRYAGRQLVLDIEPLDSAAPNYEQRLRRKNFYLRNGFRESGCFFKYCGMCFEGLYDGAPCAPCSGTACSDASCTEAPCSGTACTDASRSDVPCSDAPRTDAAHPVFDRGSYLAMLEDIKRLVEDCGFTGFEPLVEDFQ